MALVINGCNPSEDIAQRLIAWLLLVFVLACAIGGGSSRSDVLAVTGLRLIALFLLVAIFLVANPHEIRRLTGVMRFSSLAVIMIAVQLIPLPPELWAALPGHTSYAMMSEFVVGDVWRPLTMTPDNTLNALLSLVIPIATATAIAFCGEAIRIRTVEIILLLASVSAILGLLQLAPGGSGLRWYALTNDASAIGLFANRNHHGVFLAAVIPLVAVVLRHRIANISRSQSPMPLLAGSVALGLAFAAAAVATSSRVGSIAALLGIFGAVAVFSAYNERIDVGATTVRLRVAALITVALAAMAAITLILLPNSGFQRLFTDGVGDESRASWLTPLWTMMVAFMPFGSGYGSFDSVYRGFEPFELLRTTYLNAAHNDLMQIIIEGGVGALILLGLYLRWWFQTTVGLWTERTERQAVQLARAASIATGLCLIASLFDYPLRSPLMACFFATASIWMYQGRSKLVTLPTSDRPVDAHEND